MKHPTRQKTLAGLIWVMIAVFLGTTWIGLQPDANSAVSTACQWAIIPSVVGILILSLLYFFPKSRRMS